MKTMIRNAAFGAIFAAVAAASGSALAADKIQMQMNWTADTAHLGFAMAQVKGIYADHDLEVELVEGRGSAMLPLIPVFLRANGIEESQVEIVSAAESAFIGLLTSGQVDAVSQTPENIVVPLEAQGIEAGNMYFYNNGVPIASLALVAREDKLAANADVYKRFVEATALGWQEAMKDPEGSVKALLEVFPETGHSPENLLKSSKYSFASVCPAGSGDTIGVTSAETWATMYDVMTTAMNLPSTKPVTDYYSLDYVPAEPVTCP